MEKKYKLTQEYLNQLKNEYEELKVKEVKNLEVLKDAKAQGDLSENADYDAARDEQARIHDRQIELEYIFDNYELTNNKQITVLFIDRNQTETFTIVGSLESNPKERKISNVSPLGQAIVDAKVGDVVTVYANGKEFDVKVLDVK